MDKSSYPHPLHSGLGKEGDGKRSKTPEAPIRRTGLAGKKVENKVRFLRCLCVQPRLLTPSLGAVPTIPPPIQPSPKLGHLIPSHQLTRNKSSENTKLCC